MSGGGGDPGRDTQSRAILDAGSALVSSLDLEEALATVVQRIGVALDVSSAGLWRYSLPRRVAIFESFWSHDDDPPQQDDRVGMIVGFNELPDFTALSEQRQTVERHLDDPDLPPKSRRIMEKRGFKSTLEAPLVVGTDVLGSLSLVDVRSVRRFTPAERELLAGLCQLAAIGIHNAELFRRQEEQRLRALSLLESSRAVAVSLGAAHTVQSVRAQIATQLTGIDLQVHLYVDRGDGRYTRFVTEADDGAEGAENADLPTGLAETAVNEGRPVQGNSADGRALLVVPLILKDGVSGYLELAGRPARRFSDDEIGYVQTLANHAAIAVEKARLQRTIARQSGIDVVTGLYNRTYFHDRLYAEIARGYRYKESVSLIMMGVDNLDSYTDEHGESQRAEVMRALGRFLKRNLRRRVDIACRWSDEVFAILLPNTGLGSGGTANTAERLRKTMKAYEFKTQDDDLLGEISVCMGIACYPDHADEPLDLPEAAEGALHLAREKGPGRVQLARG